tara:strand:- start:8020 stop:8235 length:216 start_codon:yes stop_codon:yes gene_type:complete
MKTLTTLLVAGVLFLTSACTSTVTLGPKANETSVVGASAGTDGVSLTLPLVKGELGTATSAREDTTTKKKK